MDIILARQPIFNRDKEVVAYELLYRSQRTGASSDRAEFIDGDRATSSVVIDALLNIGLDSLTSNKPAFINFTEGMILDDYISMLPKESIVVELLEDVQPSKDLLQRCLQIRIEGYTLALDDFVFSDDHLPLLLLANIVKMDFMNTSATQLKAIVQKYAPTGIRFLAEKVETQQDYQRALEWGYEYFQGYFFAKPTVVRAAALTPSRLNLTRLMHETSKPDFDFTAMSKMIMQDMGLTMKFLKLMGFILPGAKRRGVASVRQGLVMIGNNSVRKWIYLLAMKDFAQDLPDELTRIALTASRFCESYGRRLGYSSDECFMVGLFAHGESIMNLPMVDILRDLAVSSDVKDALIYKQGVLSKVLELFLAYIQGDWKLVEELLAITGVPIEDVVAFYLEAVSWSDSLQHEVSVAEGDNPDAAQQVKSPLRMVTSSDTPYNHPLINE